MGQEIVRLYVKVTRSHFLNKISLTNKIKYMYKYCWKPPQRLGQCVGESLLNKSQNTLIEQGVNSTSRKQIFVCIAKQILTNKKLLDVKASYFIYKYIKLIKMTTIRERSLQKQQWETNQEEELSPCVRKQMNGKNIQGQLTEIIHVQSLLRSKYCYL